MRHLLAETDDQVAAWRDRLLGALGPSGQVIVDVIPALGHLIGPQPPVAPLGAAEAQNRFNRAFQQFLGVFAGRGQPLVLFLDDLQWADSATLNLLPLFLTNPETTGLLVIGAYRDKEVSATHPLSHTVELGGHERRAVDSAFTAPTRCAASGSSAERHDRRRSRRSWSAQHDRAGEDRRQSVLRNPVSQVAAPGRAHRVRPGRADLAGGSPGDSDAPYHRERGGADGRPDSPAGRADPTSAAPRRLHREHASTWPRSPVSARRIPTPAPAIFGRRWSRGWCWPTSSRTASPPISADGRPPDQRRFRFLHDRVQQAAYALIPEATKLQAHLTVGRLLLAQGDDQARPEWLFDVVNQLNYAAALMDDAGERLGLAGLDLRAGRKAKPPPRSRVRGLLQPRAPACCRRTPWDRHHALAFALQRSWPKPSTWPAVWRKRNARTRSCSSGRRRRSRGRGLRADDEPVRDHGPLLRRDSRRHGRPPAPAASACPRPRPSSARPSRRTSRRSGHRWRTGRSRPCWSYRGSRDPAVGGAQAADDPVGPAYISGQNRSSDLVGARMVGSRSSMATPRSPRTATWPSR